MEIILDKESWPEKLGINLGWDLDLITDKARELEFSAKLSTSSNQLLSIIFIWYPGLEYIQSYLIEHYKDGSGGRWQAFDPWIQISFHYLFKSIFYMNYDLSKRLIWWAFTQFTKCLKFSFQRTVLVNILCSWIIFFLESLNVWSVLC